MQSKTTWEINDTEKRPGPPKPAVKAKMRPAHQPGNPAVAFSLSLLFWGAGQIYNRQRKLGLLFILLMLNFYLFFGIIVLHWQSLSTFFKAIYVTPFHVFVASSILYACGLFAWLLGADHAYHRAAKIRTRPFQGVSNPLMPALCSLLVPGWGQVLNGQAKKGGFFLMFAMAGLLAIPAILTIPHVWPSIETAEQRLFLESMLTVAFVLVPLFIIMWIVSIFDALKVSLEEIKKEPLRKRVEYAINRIRMHGFLRGMIPQAKMTLILGLTLTFFIAFGYFLFPKNFYSNQLVTLQTRSSQNQMVILPDLISRILQATTKK